MLSISYDNQWLQILRHKKNAIDIYNIYDIKDKKELYNLFKRSIFLSDQDEQNIIYSIWCPELSKSHYLLTCNEYGILELWNTNNRRFPLEKRIDFNTFQQNGLISKSIPLNITAISWNHLNSDIFAVCMDYKYIYIYDMVQEKFYIH